MVNIYKKIYEIQQKGLAASICTIIESSGSTPRKAGAKMIVFDDKSIYGSVGGGSLEQAVIKQAHKCLIQNSPGVFEYKFDNNEGTNCGGHTKVFIEVIEPKKRLFIFGAGHIGSFLAQIASKLNFSVTLIDDRANIFDNMTYDSIKCVNTDFTEALKSLSFDKNTFVCSATYKHAIDKTIVEHCAKLNLAYLGMVGSKSKIATIKKDILSNNIVTEDEFNKINTPIGIGIVCKTPEEIAISILAKLIDVSASE